MMAWEEIINKGIGSMWQPEERGSCIIGEVLEIREGKFGKQWVIKTEDGEVVTPSHKVLQNRMASVEVGMHVKVEFCGTEPPAVRGQNPMSMYKVFVEK